MPVLYITKVRSMLLPINYPPIIWGVVNDPSNWTHLLKNSSEISEVSFLNTLWTLSQSLSSFCKALIKVIYLLPLFSIYAWYTFLLHTSPPFFLSFILLLSIRPLSRCKGLCMCMEPPYTNSSTHDVNHANSTFALPPHQFKINGTQCMQKRWRFTRDLS